MSIDTSNECKALTELADFLKKEAEEPMSPEFRTKVIERFGEEAWNRHVDRKRKFDRASRIIAEIANVQVVKTFGSGSDAVMCDSSSDMVVKCRKIASEGLHNEHEPKKCPICGCKIMRDILEHTMSVVAHMW